MFLYPPPPLLTSVHTYISPHVYSLFLVLPNVFRKATNGLQNPTSIYLSLNMLRTIDVMKNIAHEYSSFSLGVSIFLPSFIMKLGFKTTIYYYYNIHTFFSKHHKNSPIKWPPSLKNCPLYDASPIYTLSMPQTRN